MIKEDKIVRKVNGAGILYRVVGREPRSFLCADGYRRVMWEVVALSEPHYMNYFTTDELEEVRL